MKILANDGVSQAGVDKLEEAGHEVIQTKLHKNNYPNISMIIILMLFW